MRYARGQSLVEFAIVLPMALLLIFVVFEGALTGVRSAMAQHAAMRAARVSAVYQGDLADVELYAMLDRPLFRGGLTEASDASQPVKIVAVANSLINIPALGPARLLWRESPRADALTPGLSDAVLQGGDTPAPYCNDSGGYRACDYP
ncbi:MAG: TadE family protein [Pseudomonadota bacterium]